MKKLVPALCLLAFIGVVATLPFPVRAEDTATVALYNPLGESDVRVILGRVIRGFLSVVGSIALLMVVYGGVLWLTSAGNSDRIKKGKDVLVWAVLGLGVIFSAYAITNALLNALTTGSVTGA